jgi:hypothetical protein
MVASSGDEVASVVVVVDLSVVVGAVPVSASGRSSPPDSSELSLPHAEPNSARAITSAASARVADRERGDVNIARV